MVRKHQNQLIKPEPNPPSANPPAAPSVPPKRYWTCSELSSNAVFFPKFIHEPRHLTCRLHPSSPCSRRIGTADERVRKQEHGVPAHRHQSIRTPELARGCAQKVWRALLLSSSSLQTTTAQDKAVQSITNSIRPMER